MQLQTKAYAASLFLFILIIESVLCATVPLHKTQLKAESQSQSKLTSDLKILDKSSSRLVAIVSTIESQDANKDTIVRRTKRRGGSFGNAGSKGGTRDRLDYKKNMASNVQKNILLVLTLIPLSTLAFMALL